MNRKIMNTRRLDFSALALMCVLGMTAVTAGAQESTDRLTYGMGGGFSTGPAGNIGYHALATLQLRTPARFLHLRADALFAEFGGPIIQRMTSVTANVILEPFANDRVSPYLLGGGGAYSAKGNPVRAGYTLGVGLRFPGTRTFFVESRLHSFHSQGSPFGPLPYRSSAAHTVWIPLSLRIQF